MAAILKTFFKCNFITEMYFYSNLIEIMYMGQIDKTSTLDQLIHVAWHWTYDKS